VRVTQSKSPSHKRDERQFTPLIHKRDECELVSKIHKRDECELVSTIHKCDERRLMSTIHKRDERQLTPLIHKRDEWKFLRTNPLFSSESLQQGTSCQFHYSTLSSCNEISKENPWFNLFANVHAVHWNDCRVWRMRAATTH
jgi:hypothetical protein